MHIHYMTYWPNKPTRDLKPFLCYFCMFLLDKWYYTILISILSENCHRPYWNVLQYDQHLELFINRMTRYWHMKCVKYKTYLCSKEGKSLKPQKNPKISLTEAECFRLFRKKTQMWSKMEQEIVKEDMHVHINQCHTNTPDRHISMTHTHTHCCTHSTTHAVTRRKVMLQTSETHSNRAGATTSQADTHTHTHTKPG